ncbi:MAG: polyprenyl synthetase family protein [archaeon]
MSQMILEGPMRYAISQGHHPKDYDELMISLRGIRERILPAMHYIIGKYEDDPHVLSLLKGAIPKEGSYHRGSLVDIVAGKKTNTLVAAAAELFYWAGSWQDDVADNNTFRQTAKSMREFIGDTSAMYLGNALFGIVFRTMCDELPDDKLSKVMGYMSKDFHLVHKGQVLDMLMTQRSIDEISLHEYSHLIECTTGVDIASQLGIGAVLAELNTLTTNSLYSFGLQLGTLAQIRDDVLDYCDTKYEGEFVIGKLPFRDVESSKKRLPLLLTKDPSMRKIPHEIYDRIDEDFIQPRIKTAQKHLRDADIPIRPKRLLEKILLYWSDIRIFETLGEKGA